MLTRSDYTRILLLGIAVVLVAVLGIRLLGRSFRSGPTVWVARTDIASGEVVRPDMLESKKLKAGEEPKGVLDRHAIEGRVLGREKKAGEPFYVVDIERPKRLEIAEIIPEGQVLFTLKVPLGSLPVTDLRYGDRLSVVALTQVDSAGPAGSHFEPLVIAPDVTFLGYIGGGATEAAAPEKGPLGLALTPPPARNAAPAARHVVLGVSPGDVLPLAALTPEYVRVIVRSRKDVDNGIMLPLPVPTDRHAIEVLMGSERRMVQLEQP